MSNISDRFFAKVVALSSGCWLWKNATDGHGYGQINIEGIPRKAHRVAWELLVGPIPDGLDLDHLCRNRCCVNPTHLEPVTTAENTRRQLAALGHPNALKTHCPKGHPYDAANTRYASRGHGRVCRICRKEANQRYLAKKRNAA